MSTIGNIGRIIAKTARRVTNRNINSLINNESLQNQNIKNISSTHTHSVTERLNNTKRRFSTYKNISTSNDLIFSSNDGRFEKAFDKLCDKIIHRHNNPNTNNIRSRNLINSAKIDLAIELNPLLSTNIQNSWSTTNRREIGVYGRTDALSNINITTYDTKQNIVNNTYSESFIKKCNIYLEALILHHIYKYSDFKHRNAISKPYYLTHLISLHRKNNGSIDKISSEKAAFESIRYYPAKFRLYKRKINGITFRDYIQDNYENEDFIQNFFTIIKKICEILNYYQVKFGLVHNNFSLENILIDTNLNPYFINFSSACAELKINGTRKYICIDNNNIPYSKISNSRNNVSRSTDLFKLFFDIINLTVQKYELHDNFKILYNYLYRLYDYNVANFTNINVEHVVNSYKISSDKNKNSSKKNKIINNIKKIKEKQNIYDMILTYNRIRNNKINIHNWSINIDTLISFVYSRYSQYFYDLDLPISRKKYLTTISSTNSLRTELVNIIRPSYNDINNMYLKFTPLNIIKSINRLQTRRA